MISPLKALQSMTPQSKAQSRASKSERAPELPPIVLARCNETLDQAISCSIATADDYRKVAELLVRIRALAGEIEQAFADAVHAAHVAHKQAVAARDRYLKPVQEAEARLKEIMSQWLMQEYQRREAEAAEFTKALESAASRDDVAELMPYVAKQLAELKEPPRVNGISTYWIWRWRIVDEMKIPREYLRPDDQKIAAAVRTMGRMANIPGVVVWYEPVIAVKPQSDS